MPCLRGCGGLNISTGLSLCEVQILQDCGSACQDIPIGYSRLSITALGQLQICSNIGGTCTCQVFSGGVGGGGTDSLVNNGDGTFTHTAVDGSISTIDVCALIDNGGCIDSLVDNGNGTITHTAVDGTQTVINVCNLVADGGCSDSLVNNHDGTFTHTSLSGVAVDIDLCAALEESNCTWQANGALVHPIVILPATLPVTPAYTNSAPPSCININNPTDVDMYTTVHVAAVQIELSNNAVTTESLGILRQISSDGGATWAAGGACAETTLTIGPDGTLDEFVVATLCDFDATLVISAGTSIDFCVRTQYKTDTGITNAYMGIDDIRVTYHSVALPFA